MRLILTGSTTGGQYLGVALNDRARSQARGSPLDYLTTGFASFGANLTGGTELEINLGLARALQAMAREDAGSSAVAREALRVTQGVFGEAARSGGLGGLGDEAALANSVALALRAFAAGFGQVALLGMPSDTLTLANGDRFSLDTYDCGSAAKQPQGYRLVAEELARTFRLLRETMFDEARSLSYLDVTAVLVTSEFGRTNRQLDQAIQTTGSNHNHFGNMALVGGKGIEPGLFVGATDLDGLVIGTDGVARFVPSSPAHLQFDREAVMAMGHVYDFATGQVVTGARPEVYRQLDYLTSGSLVNTIFSLFGVPASGWWPSLVAVEVWESAFRR